MFCAMPTERACFRWFVRTQQAQTRTIRWMNDSCGATQRSRDMDMGWGYIQRVQKLWIWWDFIYCICYSAEMGKQCTERERAMQCNDVAPVLRCTQRDDAINVCNGMDDDDVATRNIERSSDLSTGNVVAMWTAQCTAHRAQDRRRQQKSRIKSFMCGRIGFSMQRANVGCWPLQSHSATKKIK